MKALSGSARDPGDGRDSNSKKSHPCIVMDTIALKTLEIMMAPGPCSSAAFRLRTGLNRSGASHR